MTRPCLLIAVSLALGSPVPAAAQKITATEAETTLGRDLPVVRHQLANGMTFLVLERPTSPTVSFVVQYDVGSVNEQLGNTGIAHVLEHLLFKGSDEIGTTDIEAERRLFTQIDATHDSLVAARTSRQPDPDELARLNGQIKRLEDEARVYVVPSEYERILSREGARGLNATTSYEATRYFVELPATRAELWFALESERMANPVFRGFHTELDVVMEERRTRVETSAGGFLQTMLLATAFQVHPYGVPVVGHASDLLNLGRPQVADYFEKFYGAQNAVVAVVGDVDSAQIIAWAEAYFAGIPAGQRPPPVTAVEPEQKGERRITVEFDAQPQLLMAWKAASGLHADGPALSILAAVLTAGRTTPLYRRLVLDERQATSVGAYMGPGVRFPRLFSIGAIPRAPHTLRELEVIIEEEIKAVQEAPPASALLARIRNQIKAGDYRRLQSNLGLATQLADSEITYGDWHATFERTADLLAVTAEDVQRVASTYLVTSRRTVARLERANR